jgi:hypothetical protein
LEFFSLACYLCDTLAKDFDDVPMARHIGCKNYTSNTLLEVRAVCLAQSCQQTRFVEENASLFQVILLLCAFVSKLLESIGLCVFVVGISKAIMFQVMTSRAQQRGERVDA